MSRYISTTQTPEPPTAPPLYTPTFAPTSNSTSIQHLIPPTPPPNAFAVNPATSYLFDEGNTNGKTSRCCMRLGERRSNRRHCWFMGSGLFFSLFSFPFILAGRGRFARGAQFSLFLFPKPPERISCLGEFIIIFLTLKVMQGEQIWTNEIELLQFGSLLRCSWMSLWQ